MHSNTGAQMTDTTTAARPERRKYDLIADSKITAFGVDLFRVRALISFGDVAAGDLGGYVQSEKSLDQDGDAWVSGDAQVFGDARVYGNAGVFGNARVFGNAQVYGDARVYGNAQVYGDASLAWFSRVGSEFGTLTAFRTEAGISVNRGCFNGTIDEFEAAVAERHGDSQIGAEYRLLIQFIRLRLGTEAQS